MEKISVKGKDRAPIYAFLTEKELNGLKILKFLEFSEIFNR